MIAKWLQRDAEIKRGEVTNETLLFFKEAENYGHISSMEGLGDDLFILEALLDKNEPLQLFVDGQMKQVSTKEEFHVWMEKEVPEAYKFFFHPPPRKFIH